MSAVKELNTTSNAQPRGVPKAATKTNRSAKPRTVTPVTIPEYKLRLDREKLGYHVPVPLRLSEYPITFNHPYDLSELPDSDVGKYAIIRFFGDAMKPDYRIGCFVLVDTSERHIGKDGDYLYSNGIGLTINRFAIIETSYKRLVRVYNVDEAYGEQFMAADEVQVVGRVVRPWQKEFHLPAGYPIPRRPIRGSEQPRVA
jgi:hypothetical protein